MRRIALLLVLTFMACAGTSVEIPSKFDKLVKPHEAKAMGLDRASKLQKEAFEKWAIAFALSVGEKQYNATMDDCLAQVTKALKEVVGEK